MATPEQPKPAEPGPVEGPKLIDPSKDNARVLERARKEGEKKRERRKREEARERKREEAAAEKMLGRMGRGTTTTKDYEGMVLEKSEQVDRSESYNATRREVLKIRKTLLNGIPSERRMQKMLDTLNTAYAKFSRVRGEYQGDMAGKFMDEVNTKLERENAPYRIALDTSGFAFSMVSISPSGKPRVERGTTVKERAAVDEEAPDTFEQLKRQTYLETKAKAMGIRAAIDNNEGMPTRENFTRLVEDMQSSYNQYQGLRENFEELKITPEEFVDEINARLSEWHTSYRLELAPDRRAFQVVDAPAAARVSLESKGEVPAVEPERHERSIEGQRSAVNAVVEEFLRKVDAQASVDATVLNTVGEQFASLRKSDQEFFLQTANRGLEQRKKPYTVEFDARTNLFHLQAREAREKPEAAIPVPSEEPVPPEQAPPRADEGKEEIPAMPEPPGHEVPAKPADAAAPVPPLKTETKPEEGKPAEQPPAQPSATAEKSLDAAKRMEAVEQKAKEANTALRKQYDVSLRVNLFMSEDEKKKLIVQDVQNMQAAVGGLTEEQRGALRGTYINFYDTDGEPQDASIYLAPGHSEAEVKNAITAWLAHPIRTVERKVKEANTALRGQYDVYIGLHYVSTGERSKMAIQDVQNVQAAVGGLTEEQRGALRGTYINFYDTDGEPQEASIYLAPGHSEAEVKNAITAWLAHPMRTVEQKVKEANAVLREQHGISLHIISLMTTAERSKLTTQDVQNVQAAIGGLTEEQRGALRGTYINFYDTDGKPTEAAIYLAPGHTKDQIKEMIVQWLEKHPKEEILKKK